MGLTANVLIAYPRTPHLFGSVGTNDDKWLGETESLRMLADESLIIEEKVDGTNVGIQFQPDGEMILQCRGHRIEDGMHQQYDLFKHWATVQRKNWENHLQDRYILFGEWLLARHSIHYRQLSHYFLEFDIYDKFADCFLDLQQRIELTEELKVKTVPILHTGPMDRERLQTLIGPSHFDARFEDILSGKADPLMEGLYLRTESEGTVSARAKLVRAEFIRTSREHRYWKDQPIVPNLLRENTSLWPVPETYLP
jgi:RNA ligase-like protein